MSGFGDNLARKWEPVDIEQPMTQLRLIRGGAGEVATTFAEDAGAIMGEESGALLGTVALGVYSLLALALVLGAVAVLDLVVMVLWWERNELGQLPIVGGAIRAAYDKLLQALGALVSPVNAFVDQLTHDAAKGFVSLVNAIVGMWAITTHSQARGMVQAGAAQQAVLNQGMHSHFVDMENRLHQEQMVNRDAMHGLWSRLSVLADAEAQLSHEMHSVQKLAQDTAHELAPLLSQVPQIWQWLHHFFAQIAHLMAAVTALVAEVGVLTKKVEELDQQVQEQASILVDVAAAVSVLALLAPLLDAGEEGVRCLRETAMQCGRQELKPHEGECWIESLAGIALGHGRV